MRREGASSPKWDRDEEAEPLILTPLSYISLYLPIFPYICPYFPIFPYICLYLEPKMGWGSRATDCESTFPVEETPIAPNLGCCSISWQASVRERAAQNSQTPAMFVTIQWNTILGAFAISFENQLCRNSNLSPGGKMLKKIHFEANLLLLLKWTCYAVNWFCFLLWIWFQRYLSKYLLGEGEKPVKTQQEFGFSW